MHIQSNFTLKEHVEAQERVLARSSTVRSWRYNSTIINALVSGIVVYIFFVAVSDKSFVVGLFWGIIAAIVGAVFYWNWYPSKVKRQLYDYYREQFGERDSFPIQLEFTETGIWTEQMGTQIKFEWANVEEITETEDSVDFYMRDGGGIFVKKKDFSSSEERQRFLDTIYQYLNKSRTSSNWMRAN